MAELSREVLRPDVLVIGGGMAGAIAALRAKACGASVLLVRRALGATALSSGAIDVAADLLAPPGELAGHVVDPFQAAQILARTRPFHPYGVLATQLGRLPESLRFAAAALEELVAPPLARNALWPTTLGTVKPAAMGQRSLLAANLATLPRRVAVVEFALNPILDARLLASGLERAAGALGRELQVSIVRSHFFSAMEDALRPPHELAAQLEAPGAVEKLALELKRELLPDVEAVLLAPVLGRRSFSLCAELSRALGGLQVAEILSAAPSVPGLRLQEALDAALTTAGVQRLDEEVLRRSKRFQIGARDVEPNTTVLATGKFIGGGIVREHGFREPLLGLPVFVGGRRISEEFIGDLLGEDLADAQPAFRAGVRTDARLRPLGAEGELVAKNVFAAGAVISGYDPAADKTGLGVAIFTGYLAGEFAAESARAKREGAGAGAGR